MRRNWTSVRARLAREQGLLAFLVIAYVVTGRAGLAFAWAHPAASAIWPPSGLALGAFLVLGYRVWPAVLAGAVVLYASVVGALPAVLALGAANTVEAMVAAYLINRYAGGRLALQGPGTAFRFAGLVILAGTTISPTLGTLTLAASGQAPWADYGAIWMTSSVGSVTGMLLVAPAVMLGLRGVDLRWQSRSFQEGVLLFAAVVLVGLMGYGGFPAALRGYPTEYLLFPVLLFVVVRLGRRAGVAAMLLLDLIIMGGTLNGYGPFVRSTPEASVILVQVFIAVTAVMTMALSAMTSEYLVAEAQLRELVVTDPLTGLPNYRRLIDVLTTEIARANRTEQPFAVVFFDMDGLKRINDDLGHLIGSRAVCRFAETLRASCRTTDTAARYGGDEFVAVLPDTDADGARVVIKRVSDRLAEDTDKPQLSCSAGVAVYPADGGTPTTLLSAADRALYAAKADKANARRRGVVPIHEWSNVG
ncbi:MAG: diguanylate cyclase [Vicinamibacterales bacterium]